MWTNIENIFLYIISMGAPSLVLIILGIHFLKSRSQERMAIIEKGGELPKINFSELFPSILILKTGLFLIGISLGVFTGFLLTQLPRFVETGFEEVTAYFITIPFFTGISLIISYFIKK